MCADGFLLPALSLLDLVLGQMPTEKFRHYFGALASFDPGYEVELLVHGWVKVDRATVAKWAVTNDSTLIQGTLRQESGSLIRLGFGLFNCWLWFRCLGFFAIRRPVEE